MLKVAVCVKSRSSYNRIISEFEEVEWEYINELEEIQEKIVFNEYNLAIVDEKLWWKEEVISLFKSKEINVIIFTGDFEKVTNEINEYIGNKVNLNDNNEMKQSDEENEQSNSTLIENDDNDSKIRYVETERIVEVPVEKVVEVERIIEKPIIIEKEIEVEKKVKVLKNSTISLISNSGTGKSFIAWVISKCFSNRGYRTLVLNLDKGFSARSYFGIDEQYIGIEKMINRLNDNERFTNFDDDCLKVNKKLSVLTGKLSSNLDEVKEKDFLNILNCSLTKNDITIVDNKSEINDITKCTIIHSTLTIVVFDLNPHHYNLNMLMMKEYMEILNPEKTLIVVNNAYLNSKEYKITKKNLKSEGFKNIITIRMCGELSFECMGTENTPYDFDEDFKNDIDILLNFLKVNDEPKKGFLSRIFRNI